MYTLDYETLEREYIGGQMSIRQLCRSHNIKSFSAVADYARKHAWYEKRERVDTKRTDRTVDKIAEKLSDEDAALVVTVREEMLTVIRTALYKFNAQLSDDHFRISAQELVGLIKQGLLLIGEPTSRTEEKSLAITGNLAELPPEFLAGLAESLRAARDRRAELRPVGPALPSVPPGARSN